MVSAKTLRLPDAPLIGSCRGTRELEDYSPEPVTSTFSYEPPELLLWSDTNSVWELHALGFTWKSAGYLFVHLPRDARAICGPHHARPELPSYGRILDLGRSIYHDSVAADRPGPGSLSGDSNVAPVAESVGRRM